MRLLTIRFKNTRLCDPLCDFRGSSALLLGAILVVGQAFALPRIPPYKASICFARLLAIPTREILGDQASYAERQLRQFRTATLGELYGVYGNTSPITTSSGALEDSSRRKLAARIRGIELDAPAGRARDEAEDDSRERERVGMVLHGKKEIERYWDELDSLVALGSESFSRKFMEWVKFGGTIFTGVVAAVHGLSTHGVGEYGQNIALALGMAGYWPTLLATHLWIASDTRYDERRREDRALLARMGEADWRYHSTTDVLDRRRVDSVRDPEAQVGIQVFPERARRQSEWLALTSSGEPFYCGGAIRKLWYGRTYVLNDELLYWDLEQREPALVIFLRTSRNRPLYPKPAPAPELKLETKPSVVPVTVTDRRR